jgi:hypothetical protein
MKRRYEWTERLTSIAIFSPLQAPYSMSKSKGTSTPTHGEGDEEAKKETA